MVTYASHLRKKFIGKIAPPRPFLNPRDCISPNESKVHRLTSCKYGYWVVLPPCGLLSLYLVNIRLTLVSFILSASGQC